MQYLNEKDTGTCTKIQSRKFEFEVKSWFEVKPRLGLENDKNSFLDNEQALTHSLLDENSHDDHGDDNDLIQHTSTSKNDPPQNYQLTKELR